MRRVLVVVALLSLGHLPSAALSNGAAPGLPPGSAALAPDAVQARGDSAPPPIGACCLVPTGVCQVLPQDECLSQGWVWAGPDTYCPPAPFPGPCLLPDGT
jgi:hypothetical protein